MPKHNNKYTPPETNAPSFFPFTLLQRPPPPKPPHLHPRRVEDTQEDGIESVEPIAGPGI
jgi:hypothetical protein